MLSFNYNIDTFLMPLDAYYRGRNKQDRELLDIVGGVETMVKQFVGGSTPIEPFVNLNIDRLFSIRITSVNWLIKNNMDIGNFDFVAEDALATFKNDPIFSVLYENISFAIRTNIKSIDYLLSASNYPNLSNSVDASTLDIIPELSLTQFLNVFTMSAPASIAIPYTDWLMASLHIEFGILAAFVIYKEKLSINTLKINELAFFIADAAQTFGAVTRELKPKVLAKPRHITPTFSNNFLIEQAFLAEQDIENY